jgi:hypothetical protein
VEKGGWFLIGLHHGTARSDGANGLRRIKPKKKKKKRFPKKLSSATIQRTEAKNPASKDSQDKEQKLTNQDNSISTR